MALTDEPLPANAPCTITVASCDAHLEGILALQLRNHVLSIPVDVQADEGFVFVEHTLPLLAKMAAASPQAIALSDDRVVGYCLSLPVALQRDVPSLAPMFEQFGRCTHRGRPLAAHRYIVGGQVCVERGFRGQGLLAKLYHQLRDSLARDFDVCVTEIATRNPVSIRAHEKMGFEVIASYRDPREEWVIVAWDFSCGDSTIPMGS
ncbi:MAG: GNAT family N-acetyltransferase [Arenimonas sp.]